MAKYTYGRKRDLNCYKYETSAMRYFNVAVWKDSMIFETYTARSRSRKWLVTYTKANHKGHKVTITLNSSLSWELF